MLATLQFIVKYVLILSTIIGLVFMVVSTVFIIACVIHGDISIKIVRSKDKKENKQADAYQKVEVYSGWRYFLASTDIKIIKSEKEIQKMQGTCKWFDSQKGYGFITDSEGKDVFVHHSSIIMDKFRYLNEDDIVEYELGTGNNGREQAINVQPILTMRMIKDSLKEDNLYIKTMKDGYGVTKYQVVDGNNVLQTDENGMTFMELATYANFEIVEKSA